MEKEWTVDEFQAASSVSASWLSSEVEEFVARHSGSGCERPIVCVTSGGTTVPLERNCVRFIDNFSKGNRGAASVEEFIDAGYAVIFLFRTGSLLPFLAECQDQIRSAFDRDASGCPRLHQLSAALGLARGASTQYESCKERLLFVTYSTVFEYLGYLEAICRALDPLGARAALFLAAAVSDYFQPWAEMAEHKISGPGPLELRLARTPKMLGVLRERWCPRAMVVSFKLETDEEVLSHKASAALETYRMDAVVANELHSRAKRVHLFWRGRPKQTIERQGDERVERPLVAAIVQAHRRMLGRERCC